MNSATLTLPGLAEKLAHDLWTLELVREPWERCTVVRTEVGDGPDLVAEFRFAIDNDAHIVVRAKSNMVTEMIVAIPGFAVTTFRCHWHEGQYRFLRC